MMVKLSFKNIFRNKRRTVITLAVISVGVSMLLLALAYVEFVKWGLAESTIHSQTGHFQLMTQDSLEKQEERILQSGINDWEEIVKQLETLEPVKVATSRINFSGLASTGDKSHGILISAVIPEKEILMGDQYINPEPLKLLNSDGQDSGILLAEGLAKLLNCSNGDYVTILTTTADGALNAMDFQVKGTARVFSSELDKRFAMLTINGAQNLLNSRKVGKVLVGLHQTRDLNRTTQAVGNIKKPGLALKLWHEISPYYKKVLQFFNQFIAFLTPVLMIIVCFSSMNTILMSIMERQSELASLRAMGTSKGKLVQMLFSEGVWLGILGVAVGIGSELILAYLINGAGIMLPPPPGQTSGYPLRVLNIIDNFKFVGFLTIGIVGLSTLLPALRLTKINIVKALRRI
jgi:putative ABC transport system permease protein